MYLHLKECATLSSPICHLEFSTVDGNQLFPPAPEYSKRPIYKCMYLYSHIGISFSRGIWRFLILAQLGDNLQISFQHMERDEE